MNWTFYSILLACNMIEWRKMERKARRNNTLLPATKPHSMGLAGRHAQDSNVRILKKATSYIS